MNHSFSLVQFSFYADTFEMATRLYFFLFLSVFLSNCFLQISPASIQDHAERPDSQLFNETAPAPSSCTTTPEISQSDPKTQNEVLLELYKVLSQESRFQFNFHETTPALLKEIKSRLVAILPLAEKTGVKEILVITNREKKALSPLDLKALLASSIQAIDDYLELSESDPGPGLREYRRFKIHFRNSVFPWQASHNLQILSTWDEWRTWSQKAAEACDHKSAQDVADDLKKHIRTLAIQSSNGIYTDEDRSYLNNRMLHLKETFLPLCKNWSLPNSMEKVLDDEDHIGTPQAANQFLWKIDHLNFDGSVNYERLDESIRFTEYTFCYNISEHAAYNTQMDDYPASLFASVMFTEETVIELINSTRARSQFLSWFSFEEIRLYIDPAKGRFAHNLTKTIPANLLNRVQHQAREFCRLYPKDPR